MNVQSSNRQQPHLNVHSAQSAFAVNAVLPFVFEVIPYSRATFNFAQIVYMFITACCQHTVSGMTCCCVVSVQQWRLDILTDSKDSHHRQHHSHPSMYFATTTKQTKHKTLVLSTLPCHSPTQLSALAHVHMHATESSWTRAAGSMLGSVV